MLFFLTGDVQIGKTRWLVRLVERLESAGAAVAGVVAPGVWLPSDGPRADDNGFEKVGINNELLPGHGVVPFARREDLARAEGSFDAQSQAAREQLVWHISDDAIDRVNQHFDQLAANASSAGAAARPGLLVVDELGRLELWRGEGLTSAVALLQKGPTASFPHALVVVRDYLVQAADELLADAWPERAMIAPDDAGCRAVLDAVLGNGSSSDAPSAGNGRKL